MGYVSKEDDAKTMTDNYVLYSGPSHVTGKKLAHYLGIDDYGKNDPGRQVDQLLRWGSSKRIDYIPEQQTINLRRAISTATDKMDTLDELQRAGVPTPEYSETPTDLSYPMLARNSSGMQGRDIVPIIQRKDLEARDVNAEFYTRYIPTKLEYRVHVIDGEIVKLSQKVLKEEENYDPFVRNYETGYRFVNPRTRHPGVQQAVAAVNSLDLDIGAVDMVIGEDDRPYVLEVNTAPSLEEDVSLEVYGDKIAEMMGIENYPGRDAPELDYGQDEQEESNEERFSGEIDSISFTVNSTTRHQITNRMRDLTL